MSLTFAELRAVSVDRCIEKFHDIDAWDPWDWSNAMAGETGECCNLTKKMQRIWPGNQYKQSWNKPEDLRLDDCAKG